MFRIPVIVWNNKAFCKNDLRSVNDFYVGLQLVIMTKNESCDIYSLFYRPIISQDGV